MDKPFVWPKEPTDFSAYGSIYSRAQDIVMLIVIFRWDKETYDAANHDAKKDQEQFSPRPKTTLPEDAVLIEDQAKELLEGKKKWKPTWQEFEDGR